MAAMDRRRAASKARRSADEQLDEMLAEHRARSAPPRRAQSLEPSTSMAPALKRTAATPKQTPVAPRAQETAQVPIFPMFDWHRSEISGPGSWIGYSLFLVRRGPRDM